MDIIVRELTATSALLMGQADEGIPVTIIMGLDYRVSEEENIQKTLVYSPLLREIARATLEATAGISGFKKRLVLKLLRWLL